MLAHRDGHLIVQDWMGAITEFSDQYDYTYLRTAKDFVTRKWHSFPVQNRQDWEQNIRWRYDPRHPQRFVLACSALKATYREALLEQLPDARLVHLRGAKPLIASRLGGRRGHYMNPGLLESQFAALEEPADAIVVDIGATPEAIVAAVLGQLARG